MRKKIKEIASVRSGYSFRGRIEASVGGSLAVIQMKDLLDDDTVSIDDLVKVDMDKINEHHFAQQGDLVFRSRGNISKSAVLMEDPGQAVIAAPLIRIRLQDPGKILPEYLNWYISQRNAQIFLTSRARGTVQKMISKAVIENMEVTLPGLEEQRKIVELALMSAREQTLLYALANKRWQYISAILTQYAEGEQT